MVQNCGTLAKSREFADKSSAHWCGLWTRVAWERQVPDTGERSVEELWDARNTTAGTQERNMEAQSTAIAYFFAALKNKQIIRFKRQDN